ncbi:DPP IV N-terminal domain-containing protein [Citromicrobium bathyomarinum]|uniref:S9 family peptidase n=1 Tax=unclassified Citromicrobium TaxID=2630544 RepID=UPI0006C902B9|nr:MULTISPECIES: S9 family peptidase [unclassified Citromicrobium]KPM24988.1 peptidase S9 [Citromicrobium sp. RCC1885]KPM28230.1 peptidase S9 [Citromicrobium sp. RCC1878]MAO03674.1 S9 family peptidase [Citromicrobium sp.]OAM10246.1 peptidase S9 [Citromicrobium sp. RCC1897]|tara:strand:- start:2452 stop:4692 length:2241 start_codon:yes stop_codon:yes gene_type:complete
MRHLLAAAAILALATPLAAQESDAMTSQATQNADLTIERVFASPGLDGPSPRQAKLSPDGRYLTLLRNRADDRERYDLWGYDRQSGEWTMLVDSEALGSGRELSEDEKMQRERARVGNLKGIIAYQWNADGSGVLVPLDGDLYLAKLDGTVTRLTDTEESELNPKLSPEGEFVSFVRDRQLWVGPVGGDAQPITPKEGELIRWGEAEFVAQEEMGRMTGFWWNPDDTRLAVQRTDESPVGVVTRAAIGATGTKVFDQRYPVAGSDNAIVELFVMDPDGANRVKVDLGDDPDIYLARVDWAPDGSALYVQRQNREQTRLDMLRVDPATGASEVWFTEEAARPDYWINLSDNYRFLDDGSLLWWSERDGYGQFYRFDGEDWQQLTSGDEPVTSLVGLNEETGVFFYQATTNVLTQQIYRAPLDGKAGGALLTDPGFTNSASMDQQGQTLLISRSSPSQPPQSYLADTDGQRLAWVEENALDADHPYAPYLASHVWPEFGTLPAEDGTPLHYMMLKPKMEPGKKYPVFIMHYGGPGPQMVDRGWKGALAQAIVDKGYVYFVLDNRGSANRGVAFEQPIYHAMGGVEVRDQKAGAEFLKSLDFVDPDKLAIYGWSYGGYMTLKQLQADPGLYAAGVSGAPVTRWELYDTHYTERFMGDPNTVPEAYEAASAIPKATEMTDPLLLIHGMADDNVVFENSTELISTLQEAAVPFEMMLYPGYTHRVSGPKISVHLWHTIFDFLDSHGVTPPE